MTTASLVDRFLARLTDLVLLDLVLSGLQLAAPRHVAMAVFVAVSLGYVVGLETQRGATVGQRSRGLRVTTVDGARPSAYQSLSRHLVDLWPVGFVVPGAAYAGPVTVLAALIGAAATAVALHRGELPWADRLAGTGMVYGESLAQVHA